MELCVLGSVPRDNREGRSDWGGMVVKGCFRRLTGKFRRKAFGLKPLDAVGEELGPSHGLKKALGAFDLLMFGVGSIVGSGVFVVTGEAARKYAG